MTKTDIGIYRGLKEKFDPEVHVGFFITTDTGELLLGDQSLGQTISGWEINDGVLTLKLNTGKDIRVTFPEATETVKGLLSAADKAQLNALQANLDSKVDKVTGKSLLADSEIEKLAGLPNSTELTNSIATAKAAGDNAQSDLNAHKQNKSNPHEVTKAQVGLGNVTNDAQVKRSEMGVANGVATLDADGKVPASQLPSYVDDIIDVYATYSKSDTGVLSDVTLYLDAAHTQLVTGEAGKIYQNIADGEPQYQFRWTGTIFSQTGASSLILGEVTGTAYDGAKGKANADNIAEIKGTSLSHIKDVAPVTTTVDKVSINYECYEGNQYGAAGTDHTADIPAATTAKAGVMSSADKAKLEDLNSKLVVADEEDVTAVDGKIKFKDRDTTNGMGYKILRLPENGILTQDMINQANTIYEIRYGFYLNGATITIPENCALKFEGGSLDNGTLDGNGAIIDSDNHAIFGSSLSVLDLRGIGRAEYFSGVDIQKCLNSFHHVQLLPNRRYQLTQDIEYPYSGIIEGSGGTTVIPNGYKIYVGYNGSLHDLNIETNDANTVIVINDNILSKTLQQAKNPYYPANSGVRIFNMNIMANTSKAVSQFSAVEVISAKTTERLPGFWGVRIYDSLFSGPWKSCVKFSDSNNGWITDCSIHNSKAHYAANFLITEGSRMSYFTLTECSLQYYEQNSEYFMRIDGISNLTVDKCIPWDWGKKQYLINASTCSDITISNAIENYSKEVMEFTNEESIVKYPVRFSRPGESYKSSRWYYFGQNGVLIEDIIGTQTGSKCKVKNLNRLPYGIHIIPWQSTILSYLKLAGKFKYYQSMYLKKEYLNTNTDLYSVYAVNNQSVKAVAFLEVYSTKGTENDEIPEWHTHFEVQNISNVSSVDEKKVISTGLYGFWGTRMINLNSTTPLDPFGHTAASLSGTTSQRPSNLLSRDEGYMYFDKTLNRPVYWNGTKWIDPAEDSIKWRTIE